MTLIDTSAWIEFMRAGDRRLRARARRLLARGDAVVTDPVVMELIAGARHGAEERRLRSMLYSLRHLPVGGLDDWERAAAVYRVCRARGATPRSQIDCLIAAVAIREGVPVLHADRDFDAIARHTPLEVLG